MAQLGEFKLRTFLGKIDLNHAEAVADLIVNSASTQQLTIQQIRVGFSSEIIKLH